MPKIMKRHRWYFGIAVLFVVGLVFVSCTSNDSRSPVSPAGDADEQWNFFASRGSSANWGAYTDGTTFRVNVPAAGDYQLRYETRNGVFFIVFNTPEPALIDIGLNPDDLLSDVCISKGTIVEVPDESSEVGIRTSGPVTVYSWTDANGGEVPWWVPADAARRLFTSDGSAPVCVIADGEVIEGVDLLDSAPPPPGGGTAGPPPAACPGGGEQVAGSTACWYTSVTSGDCTTICIPNGGTHDDTINFAGSVGTAANCDLVLAQLGYGGTPPFDPGSGAPYNEIGCSFFNPLFPDGRRWYVGATTTHGAAAPDADRACACQQ